MKITKKTESLTYSEKNTVHTFEVNGKTVAVNCYSKIDPVFPEDDEYDLTINEDDAKNLTEEECEAIGENLRELIDLKCKDTFEV